MIRLHVLLLRALDQLGEVAQQGLASPPIPSRSGSRALLKGAIKNTTVRVS